MEVKNQAEQEVGCFDTAGWPPRGGGGCAEFKEWHNGLQRKMGGKIGFAVGDDCLIDRPNLMQHLPPGQHEAILVQKMPLPRRARSKSKGCDMWRAV